MQYPQKIQIKTAAKKLYTSPSATNFTSKYKSVSESNQPKPARFRRTDHTDDKNSEISNSQIQQHNIDINGLISEQADIYMGDSRISKNYRNGDNVLRLLTDKQEKIVQSRQRLKNIHHFYRIRIQQERNKNIQRNQIFIGIIQELQKTHNDKILALQKSLQQMQDQKRQIGLVDERMGSIKSTIQDILKQSQDLKTNNDKLQKQILKKQVNLKQKQAQSQTIKQELDTMRQKLQQFERLKLKQNKRTKQLLQMIQHIF